MKVTKCHLDGILLIELERFSDERGFFLETFEESRYQEHGICEMFVQGNHSRSVKDVLRGLHFTRSKPQSQIVTVIRGRIFDVVVDVRKESPSYGKWFGTELAEGGPSQLYMPHGFAHGFCVLSDWADLHYMVSQRYDPQDEGGLLWNDEDVGIGWPTDDPIISSRDRCHPKLGEL
jgi:dTDP-4-dehydrorhamnose 3,5-epimerase